MASNGNGTAPTQQLEKLAEVAVATGAGGKTVEDFLARVDDALQLLTTVGQELGHVGKDDEANTRTFADQVAEDVRRYVAQLLARKRRELGDLERILGKIGG